MIKVENISVKYPDQTIALQNLTFAINEFDSVGIIGANGAGKSTLMLTLLGILPLIQGKVELCGLELNKKNLIEIRKNVGLVFQNPDDQLFMPSVFDDICFGLNNLGFSKKCVESRANGIMQKLNIMHLAKKIPERLSGGEKRIVAIAEILVLNPRILMLDEPTSFLDPRAKRELISIINAEKLTKLISTHDFEFAKKVCNKILFLKNGQLFAYDKSEKILLNENLLMKGNL